MEALHEWKLNNNLTPYLGRKRRSMSTDTNLSHCFAFQVSHFLIHLYLIRQAYTDG